MNVVKFAIFLSLSLRQTAVKLKLICDQQWMTSSCDDVYLSLVILRSSSRYFFSVWSSRGQINKQKWFLFFSLVFILKHPTRLLQTISHHHSFFLMQTFKLILREKRGRRELTRSLNHSTHHRKKHTYEIWISSFLPSHPPESECLLHWRKVVVLIIFLLVVGDAVDSAESKTQQCRVPVISLASTSLAAACQFFLCSSSSLSSQLQVT